MKLHVVFDRDGKILGAAQLGGAERVRARPIADEKEGQRAADVYVPPEYQHYDLAGVCQRLRVDVEGPFPNLKPRER
jgi:hypothetical protein